MVSQGVRSQTHTQTHTVNMMWNEKSASTEGIFEIRAWWLWFGRPGKSVCFEQHGWWQLSSHSVTAARAQWRVTTNVRQSDGGPTVQHTTAYSPSYCRSCLPSEQRRRRRRSDEFMNTISHFSQVSEPPIAAANSLLPLHATFPVLGSVSCLLWLIFPETWDTKIQKYCLLEP